jgi:hypothetical protein
MIGSRILAGPGPDCLASGASGGGSGWIKSPFLKNRCKRLESIASASTVKSDAVPATRMLVVDADRTAMVRVPADNTAARKVNLRGLFSCTVDERKRPTTNATERITIIRMIMIMLRLADGCNIVQLLDKLL